MAPVCADCQAAAISKRLYRKRRNGGPGQTKIQPCGNGHAETTALRCRGTKEKKDDTQPTNDAERNGVWKSLLVVVGVASFWVASEASAAAQTENRALVVVNTREEALLARDTEAVVATFADDATVRSSSGRDLTRHRRYSRLGPGPGRARSDRSNRPAPNLRRATELDRYDVA